jgi:hypothetical protein
VGRAAGAGRAEWAAGRGLPRRLGAGAGGSVAGAGGQLDEALRFSGWATAGDYAMRSAGAAGLSDTAACVRGRPEAI